MLRVINVINVRCD